MSSIWCPLSVLTVESSPQKGPAGRSCGPAFWSLIHRASIPQYLAGLGAVSAGSWLPGLASPLPWPGFRAQDPSMGTGVAPPTVASCPLTTCLLSAPSTLGSAALEVLAPKRGVSPLGDKHFHWTGSQVGHPYHYGLLMPLNQRAKGAASVPAGVTDPGR